MPIKSKYLFVASMDVDPAKEALFNEVYDTEHVPFLSKVPGVHGVTRMQGEPFSISLGRSAWRAICSVDTINHIRSTQRSAPRFSTSSNCGSA